MGISRTFSPWTDRTDVTLKGVPQTPRALDCLNVAWASRLLGNQHVRAPDATLRSGFYVDLTQAVQRKPWGPAHSLCQGSSPQYLLHTPTQGATASDIHMHPTSFHTERNTQDNVTHPWALQLHLVAYAVVAIASTALCLHMSR